MNCNPLTKTSVIVASSNLAELLQSTCTVGCRRVVFVTSSRRKILVSSSLSFSPLSPPQAIPHCTRPSSLSYTTSSSCVTDSRKMRKMGMRELLVIGQLHRSPPTQPHAPHPPPSPLGNSLSLPSPSPSPRVVIQFSSGLTWCLLRDTSLFQCSSQLPLIQLVVGSVSSDLLFYTG